MYKQTFCDGQNVYSVYMIHRYVNENSIAVHHIPLNKFRHTRDWKIWGDYDNPFETVRWSVNDVLENPNKYKRDYNNILKADLSFPIIAVYTPLDTYIIIDGNHRHGKSILKNKKTISAFVFTDPVLFKKFKIGKHTKKTWDKINKMSKKYIDILYNKKFMM